VDAPLARERTAHDMEAFFAKVWTIVVTLVDPRNLSHPELFQKALTQPGVYWAALVAVSLIVFTETGLLIGFLLPGDSLLVVVGVAAHLSAGEWDLPLLMVCLCVAAVAGDTVGYWIGWKAGPAIFNRPSNRFFKQEHLQRAKTFYERHGGKTIIFARFVPIVRTFVPVVAGAARMEYKSFVFFNVFGGISWIVSMVLFGFYLIPIADPPMQSLLGKPDFTWAKHIDKVVVAVILVSVLPIAWKAFRHWLETRNPAAGGVAAVPANEGAGQPLAAPPGAPDGALPTPRAAAPPS
jgi:membrane-associated protein